MSDSNSIAIDEAPVVRDVKDFDRNSGGWLERLIFNHRAFILLVMLLASVFLGWEGSRLVVNGSFDRLIPQNHPYIKNYFDNKDDLRPIGNAVRIVVENTDGTVFDRDYLEFLSKVNDKAFLIRGVDRPWVKSLWMASVRWQEVTEHGFESAPVMMQGFTGTPEQIAQVRDNVQRAGIIGSIVANDLRSSMIVLPLLDTYPDSGKAIDYGEFGREVESQIRAMQTPKFRIRVVGFGKLVGDLISGLGMVQIFFAASALIATVVVLVYTRCIRSTVLLVTASVLGVVWLLGLMRLFGFDLDPYSILVPFLIFAIGLSHGAQKMNGIMLDVGRGTHRYVAARYTFRRLFLTGLTALLTNVVGFAVMMVIDIPVIHDMALTASMGVLVLIFTKLVVIPVALSYIGVSTSAAQRSVRENREDRTGRGIASRFWTLLVAFTRRGPATAAVIAAAIIGGSTYLVSRHVQVGDLDAGAPELRSDSVYNRDIAYVNEHYGLSTDQFVVMVQGASPKDPAYKNVSPSDESLTCDRDKFKLISTADKLEWTLQNTPGVQATTSAGSMSRYQNSGLNEGNPKWLFNSRSPRQLYGAVRQLLDFQPGTITTDCSFIPVTAYLSDHKAATLAGVLAAVERFAAENSDKDVHILPAAGSAGIESLTNIVVAKAQHEMLFLVYGAVILLCFITFRDWRAVLVALIPLLITSSICEALMVWLGIGIKVATLPVIALGVGVGVDYALYILSIQLALQRQGVPLAESYRRSLEFTGRIVALIGVTMAAGVVTWAWSPIKFQADMGILLTFMFLWNMIGALILIPALSHFLLPGVGARGAEAKTESGAAPRVRQDAQAARSLPHQQAIH
ncbi:RND family transporter [Ideonella sp. B508-1]|uniref:efflux RND transporter permease subunit n=1 Tax=Ideonella sp. B508-1 TaxID=137716 RepID=UPI00034701D0|nr:MMPL family transporter [Ideonella sp. B508-1]